MFLPSLLYITLSPPSERQKEKKGGKKEGGEGRRNPTPSYVLSTPIYTPAPFCIL